MKKKIFVIIAVVAAVMALGIGSALAFGGNATHDTQSSGSGDCDGTCDNDRLEPQDGTGNQYGQQEAACEDGTCEAGGNGNGSGDCDGTCDSDRMEPQDGTGNQYGAGNASNGDAPRDGSGRQYGRSL